MFPFEFPRTPLSAIRRSSAFARRAPSALARHGRIALIGLSVLLASCGGGGGGGGSEGGGTTGGSPPEVPQTLNQVPATAAEAHRFLTQATFGPTDVEIARVRDIGYSAWIDEQFDMRLQHTHVQTVDASAAALNAERPTPRDIVYTWWTHAVKDPAQLRQRVAFALSQIFVVSTSTVDHGRIVASYMDMLTDKADANFRDLLEAVALHPAMGQYLSHLGNRKEDPATGRVPDENFAREVMQLFSIGLHELDDSGRPRLLQGAPIETYTADDVKGLARVFTGFSWYRPPEKSGTAWWLCFWRAWECESSSQLVTGMSGYTEVHSTSEKRFLGVTVPVQPVANPQASLRAALDRLASHPNVAPFIGKQLIQRLVTSNPSDRYVADITQVFRSSQGNLRAVVKAILLHDEARSPAAETLYTYGKIREPVIRYAHVLRAIPHVSDTYAARVAASQVPFYRAEESSDPGTQLGQTPMRSPSVFNFFRPGYQPQQTLISDAGLLAPEMQITNETAILGFSNAVASFLDGGWGQWNPQSARWDVQFVLSGWDNLVGSPAGLIDAISHKLLARPLPNDIRDEAIASISNMLMDTPTRRRLRVQAAIMFVVMSPDFFIQQ